MGGRSQRGREPPAGRALDDIKRPPKGLDLGRQGVAFLAEDFELGRHAEPLVEQSPIQRRLDVA